MTLSGSSDSHYRTLLARSFGSLSHSARYQDLRPLANPFVAAQALSHAMNSLSHNGSSPAHPQSGYLIWLHEFGLERVPLYNPHRTR